MCGVHARGLHLYSSVHFLLANPEGFVFFSMFLLLLRQFIIIAAYLSFSLLPTKLMSTCNYLGFIFLTSYEILTFWYPEFHLSFNEAHNYNGVKCGPHLPFLCAVWKFHKNPIKLKFICAASSTSLTEVSKWLSSFFKAMFPVVNDL